MEEQPIYVVKQSLSRALVPKFVTLFVLGVIFYLGILLNLSLLELQAEEESLIKLVSLILLLLIIAFGAFLSFHRANLAYNFYQNRITFNKKQIPYTSITNTTPKRDLFDKIFKTYSISLGEDFHFKHVPTEIQLQPYLQQLLGYARRN